jgi:hypothetical protein
MKWTPGLVVDVEQGGKFRAVSEGNAPKIKGPVAMLRNHLDDRRWLVLVRDACGLCLHLFILGLVKITNIFFV